MDAFECAEVLEAAFYEIRKMVEYTDTLPRDRIEEVKAEVERINTRDVSEIQVIEVARNSANTLELKINGVTGHQLGQSMVVYRLIGVSPHGG